MSKENIKLNKTRELVVESLKESLKNDSFFLYIEKWKKNYNPITKTEYQGINKLLLSHMMNIKKWDDNRFLTFNQIKNDPKLHLKEKAKGVPIEYWYLFDKKEKVSLSFFEAKKLGVKNNDIGKGEDKRYSMCSRCYYVFNAKDIEGLDPLKNHVINNSELKAENVLLNYCSKEKIELNHYSDHASYSIVDDKINIPSKNHFIDNKSYLQVWAHEVIHSTGNENRLNREIQNSFGTENYALEELKAEIGSAILCSELHIQQSAESSNKGYIQNWLSCLEDKPTEFLKALNDTLKAVDFVEEKGEMERIYSHEDSKINIVNESEMTDVIENRKPEEKFLRIDEENNIFVCCDNRTRDAWTEQFDNLNDAISWLNDEFEINDYIEKKNEKHTDKTEVKEVKEVNKNDER